MVRRNKSFRESWNLSPRKIKLMHVCGSHEVTIAKYGLRSLLPDWIEVIGGPGCPVCVTNAAEIDEAIELARRGHLITTFGDLFRAPGTHTSLADAKTDGADVIIVYGATDAVEVARRNPEGNVIAQEKMGQVFEVTDKTWRGFPIIPASAFRLRSNFECCDAHKKFNIRIEGAVDTAKGCKCGEILRGLVYPHECPLFGKACTPLKPIGPCMVSSEGTCNIAFKYDKHGKV